MKKRTAKKRIPVWLYVLLVVILAAASIWQARQNEAEQVEENRRYDSDLDHAESDALDEENEAETEPEEAVS